MPIQQNNLQRMQQLDSACRPHTPAAPIQLRAVWGFGISDGFAGHVLDKFILGFAFRFESSNIHVDERPANDLLPSHQK